MTTKKYKVAKTLVKGGFGLSLGSTVIGKLPASAAQSGVQAGLSKAGSFFPVMGTIGGASIVTKQLRNLKKK